MTLNIKDLWGVYSNKYQIYKTIMIAQSNDKKKQQLYISTEAEG